MRNIREKVDNNAGTAAVNEDTNSKLKRFGIYGAIGLALFLLGFVPMWLSANSAKNARDASQLTLRQSALQNGLATAALNARRGEYEQARQEASSFFTELRTEVESEQSAFSSPQREAVQPILAARDETITMLARNDPAAGERLSDLYFNLIQVRN